MGPQKILCGGGMFFQSRMQQCCHCLKELKAEIAKTVAFLHSFANIVFSYRVLGEFSFQFGKKASEKNAEKENSILRLLKKFIHFM